MKKICLIVPYFGRFPNYFQLWLNSVKYNPKIDFLIITDDETDYEYPDNVILKIDSFENIRKRVKDKYNFNVPLKSPYKLCDFKVAYGDIFEKELRGYDFWGYCDVDLIFGNIREFITDDVLDNYDKINTHGHLSLYRNNDEMRYLYKLIFKGLINYKIAFSTDWIYHFDEYPGMANIVKKAKIKMIDVEDYADIDRFIYKFRKVYDHSEKPDDTLDIKQVFRWNQGILSNILKTSDGINTQEIMYIHLQKRTMHKSVDDNCKDFYIVPNDFIRNNEDIANIIEMYSINKKYGEWKIFKKECFRQKFKLMYWKMKINTTILKISGEQN